MQRSIVSSPCTRSDRIIRTGSRSKRRQTKTAFHWMGFHSILITRCTIYGALPCFCWCFARLYFFAPEMGGYFLEANNFIPADPMKTPTEIAPVWYFTAFYSMLRATTDTFKIVLMAALGAISAFGMLRARRLKHKLAIALGAALAL